LFFRTSHNFSVFPVAAVLAAAACGGVHGERAPSAAVTSAYEATDDGGHVVRLDKPAQRIISLIPSATETLVALGAVPQIVGRTRYDVAPEVSKLPSVGGGVDPSIEAIVSLHPDLVVVWESDKRQALRERLLAVGVPVFILRTQDTSDVFRGLARLGRLTGHDSVATRLAKSIRDTLQAVQRSVAGMPNPSVFYVVYNDPPMTAGAQTFIGQLIGLAGGHSIFADLDKLWPTVSMEEIVRRDPDVVIVPIGEFKTNALERFRGLPGWRDLRAVRAGNVVTVPANLSERPGPAIGAAARALAVAMHRNQSVRTP
jgi:iron complex transport system substrate-binding protein